MTGGSVFRRPQPEASVADRIIFVASHGEVGAQSKDRMPEASASEKCAVGSSKGSGMPSKSDLPASGPRACESAPGRLRQCFKATRTKRRSLLCHTVGKLRPGVEQHIPQN